MDGAASKAAEAPPPTGGDAESSSEASVEVEQQHTVPPLPAGVLSDSGGAAFKAESGGEEEDEQVERFFALLANIRALRAMHGARFAGGCADCGEGALGAAGRGRKRPRDAEPPWRPAFRLEDFETEERHVKKMEGTDGAMRSAVRTWTGAVADDHGEDDGEVVETSSCPVAASRRASDVG